MTSILVDSDASVVYVLRQQPSSGWEVLLLRRADSLSEFWLSVVGGIETGETAAQTARRELREETGIIDAALYCTGTCEQFFDHRQNKICILPLFVAIVAPDAGVTLNEEHMEYRWFSFDEAYKAVPFFNQRACLDHIRENFIDREPHPFRKVA